MTAGPEGECLRRATHDRARDRSRRPRRLAARFTRARCGRCRTRPNGKATKTKFGESGPPPEFLSARHRFEPEALGNVSSVLLHLSWRRPASQIRPSVGYPCGPAEAQWSDGGWRGCASKMGLDRAVISGFRGVVALGAVEVAAILGPDDLKALGDAFDLYNPRQLILRRKHGNAAPLAMTAT